MTKNLVGRVALVTGATRSIGIGAAICRALAARGAKVAFTSFTAYDAEMYDSDVSEPDRLEAELREIGADATNIPWDLTPADKLPALLDVVEETLGPLSILVNNAAYSTRDGWEALTAEELDRHYQVNARATAMLSVEFCRRFQGESGGRIINFSSGQHLGPMSGELAYAMSKAAIITFTQSLAPAVIGKSITVNAVNPGVTDTGWITDEIREWLLPMMPAGRFGTPEDAARVVAWLASDEAAWLTGQVINSEGGMLR
ncbi:MAG TPA: SDR family oxidoreductase [Thermomicrobiales bacterium]|nr:SDR family oxidoreductase [Thermomicrobiales bacterium]